VSASSAKRGKNSAKLATVSTPAWDFPTTPALHRTPMHHTALHRTPMHHTAPHRTPMHRTSPHPMHRTQCTALQCTSPHRTPMHHTPPQQELQRLAKMAADKSVAAAKREVFECESWFRVIAPGDCRAPCGLARGVWLSSILPAARADLVEGVPLPVYVVHYPSPPPSL